MFTPRDLRTVYKSELIRDVKIETCLVNGEDTIIGVNNNIAFTEDHAFLFSLLEEH